MCATPTPSPLTRPPRAPRYGLMNARGEYFCHAYRYGDKWHEWDLSAHDAHEWVDLDACRSAARAWELIHEEPLLVIKL